MKKSDLKNFINFLLDFIWPQFCLGCKTEGRLICGLCLDDILLKENTQITWPDKSDYFFTACHAACDYQNPLVQKLLKNFKYGYLENLADSLVDILERQARRLGLPRDTIITNIALHAKKRKQRGFDQTAVLAKKLARRLNLEYTPLLKRVKYTQTQAKLHKKDRLLNVADAFAARKNGQNQTILLIDDVTTTGSTLDAAAKALKNARFGSIICLVLAKNN